MGISRLNPPLITEGQVVDWHSYKHCALLACILEISAILRISKFMWMQRLLTLLGLCSQCGPRHPKFEDPQQQFRLYVKKYWLDFKD